MSLFLCCYLYYRTATAINEEKYDTNVQYTVDCINTAGNIIIIIIIIIVNCCTIR